MRAGKSHLINGLLTKIFVNFRCFYLFRVMEITYRSGIVRVKTLEFLVFAPIETRPEKPHILRHISSSYAYLLPDDKSQKTGPATKWRDLCFSASNGPALLIADDVDAGAGCQ